MTDIFKEKQSDGMWVKSIEFKFPLIYNDLINSNQMNVCSEDNEMGVNCSDPKSDQYITVTVETREVEQLISKKSATYDMIKGYVLKKYGVKIHTLFIAQIKRELGLIERKNYNHSKKSKKEQEKIKKRKCSEENRKYIIEALNHFGVI